ncbi:hypothetical protein Ndes2526B_g06674 [Nannochloris sp. 'desiccata']
MADFIITALLPVLTTLIAEAAQGDARAQLSAIAQVDIPSEIMFIVSILVMLMALGPLSKLLAQIAGALSGAIAASKYLPATWALRGQALVATTQPGIDIIGGASSEFLLTYLVSLLVIATQRSSRGRFIKYWTPLFATAAAS